MNTWKGTLSWKKERLYKVGFISKSTICRSHVRKREDKRGERALVLTRRNQMNVPYYHKNIQRYHRKFNKYFRPHTRKHVQPHNPSQQNCSSRTTTENLIKVAEEEIFNPDEFAIETKGNLLLSQAKLPSERTMISQRFPSRL